MSSTIRLDVKDMPRGMYIVMVRNKAGGITRKKLLITR